MENSITIKVLPTKVNGKTTSHQAMALRNIQMVINIRVSSSMVRKKEMESFCGMMEKSIKGTGRMELCMEKVALLREKIHIFRDSLLMELSKGPKLLWV